MSKLKSNLIKINNEIQDKIIPDNIKKGINIFGVDGTLDSIVGSNVRVFKTKEELDSSTDAQVDDLALIYKNEIQSLSPGVVVSSLTFPETVVLSEAYTSNYYCDIESTDTSVMFQGNCMLDSTSFRFDAYYDGGRISVMYNSRDGITYTRVYMQGNENKLTNSILLPTTIKVHTESEWDINIENFMKSVDSYFGGIYIFTSTNTWEIAPTQLSSITPSDLIANKSIYASNGIVESDGSIGIPDNSLTDVSAMLYSQIQQYYENMTPIILTETNKTINKNIYTIPVKMDGTVLLDTGNITNGSYMFRDCKNLTVVPLLNTSNINTAIFMFSGCLNVSYISNLDTTNITNMYAMFSGCKSLKAIPNINTSNVINMVHLFSSCTNLLTVSNLNTSKAIDISNMFLGCTNLITVSGLDTSNVTDFRFVFENCSSLTTVSQLNMVKATNTAKMFLNCHNLVSVPNLDTRSLQGMQNMFSYCYNLENAPMMITNQVWSMDGVFANCYNLKNVPFYNTSNVSDFSYAFYNCWNLLNVPSLSTYRCNDLYNIFTNCPNLTNDSLNNIMLMCANATRVTNKSFLNIGLTENQINICKTLDNYTLATSAGWK